MSKDRIIVEKDLIPCRFDILLGDELFGLVVSYNKTHDFFTVGLEKDGETICEGEPVVYGFPLFNDFYQPEIFPGLEIIPQSTNDEEQNITFETLGETVFLTIDNQDESGDSIG